MSQAHVWQGAYACHVTRASLGHVTRVCFPSVFCLRSRQTVRGSCAGSTWRGLGAWRRSGAPRSQRSNYSRNFRNSPETSHHLCRCVWRQEVALVFVCCSDCFLLLCLCGNCPSASPGGPGCAPGPLGHQRYPCYPAWRQISGTWKLNAVLTRRNIIGSVWELRERKNKELREQLEELSRKADVLLWATVWRTDRHLWLLELLTEPRTYLEVVFDCTISQITADGEARAAVLVCAAGPGLCSLQSGSRPLVSVLVSPLAPAPVTVIG